MRPADLAVTGAWRTLEGIRRCAGKTRPGRNSGGVAGIGFRTVDVRRYLEAGFVMTEAKHVD